MRDAKWLKLDAKWLKVDSETLSLVLFHNLSIPLVVHINKHIYQLISYQIGTQKTCGLWESGASGAISHFSQLIIQLITSTALHFTVCMHLHSFGNTANTAHRHQTSILPKLHPTVFETLCEMIYSGITLCNLWICTLSVFLTTSLATFN